jgi:ATP-dependent RNA helicase DeaD
MNLPSVDAVNAQRIAKFKQRVTETIAKGEMDAFRPVLEQLEAETGIALIDIAAALASLSQGSTPLLLAAKPEPESSSRSPAPQSAAPPRSAPRADEEADASARARRDSDPSRDGEPSRAGTGEERRTRKSRPGEMETYRLEVGAAHGIKPGNIVGAIANEAGIEGVHIGRVDIREDHSYVDLPEGMPKNIFKGLQKVRVAGRELRISRVTEKPPKPARNPAGRHTERKLLTRR